MLRRGLHGDGVPFAATMRDSLECLSWNILTDKTGMMLLVATFAKSFGACRITWDALRHASALIMRNLMLCIWPSRRHDAMPWQPRGNDTRTMAGKDLGAHAGLLQTRGDWAFCLDFPPGQRGNVAGVHSPGLDCDFRYARLIAAWRAHRYTSHEFVFLQRTSGMCPSLPLAFQWTWRWSTGCTPWTTACCLTSLAMSFGTHCY